MSARMIAAIAMLALAGLACGVNVDLPKVPTAGPTTTERIDVAAPSGGEARLTISFGAGDLKLAPGASQLVAGTAEYNIEALKPEVITDGSAVEIKQGDMVGLVEPSGVKNDWDFRLGSMPMDLTINAGAYSGEYEFGGLSLTGLTIKDGAASVDLSFDRPNASSMQVLRYETGASEVSMTGLANANFSTMIFDSGAGTYELEFDGDLQRDATVTISTGLSNVKLVIPEGIPATITMEAGVSNIQVASGWKQDGDRYTQEGSGPALTFIVKGGVGNLTVTD